MSGPHEPPLRGLRVVDFSRLLPGPFATMVLADLGAEVVKVEPPRGGDYVRWLPPRSAERPDVSAVFAALNAGKRSVALNLKTDRGVEAARALAARADVVVEAFRPGVMERLGLGPDVLRADDPRLVYVSVTGYGAEGPYRDRAGHDLNYQGLSGVLGLAGPSDGPPAVPPVQLADLGGGAMWSLVGILAALHARERTGEGRHLDVSMTEGAMAYLQSALAPHLSGAPAPQRGAETLTGGQPCYNVYETADGRYMTLAALEPGFWSAFCEAVERPDLTSRQYGDEEQAAATRRELAELFRSRTRAEWEAVFREVDACCEPVLEPEELSTHTLHRDREQVIRDQEGRPRLRTPLGPSEERPPGPAPSLGRDTEDVLGELGYDGATLEGLRRDGVISR